MSRLRCGARIVIAGPNPGEKYAVGCILRPGHQGHHYLYQPSHPDQDLDAWIVATGSIQGMADRVEELVRQIQTELALDPAGQDLAGGAPQPCRAESGPHLPAHLRAPMFGCRSHTRPPGPSGPEAPVASTGGREPESDGEGPWTPDEDRQDGPGSTISPEGVS